VAGPRQSANAESRSDWSNRVPPWSAASDATPRSLIQRATPVNLTTGPQYVHRSGDTWSSQYSIITSPPSGNKVGTLFTDIASELGRSSTSFAKPGPLCNFPPRRAPPPADCDGRASLARRALGFRDRHITMSRPPAPERIEIANLLSSSPRHSPTSAKPRRTLDLCPRRLLWQPIDEAFEFSGFRMTGSGPRADPVVRVRAYLAC